MWCLAYALLVCELRAGCFVFVLILSFFFLSSFRLVLFLPCFSQGRGGVVCSQFFVCLFVCLFVCFSFLYYSTTVPWKIRGGGGRCELFLGEKRLLGGCRCALG